MQGCLCLMQAKRQATCGCFNKYRPRIFARQCDATCLLTMQRIPGTLTGQTSQQLSLPLISIHTVSHPQMGCAAQHPSCNASSCQVSAACASPPVPDALMCEATRKTREMIMKLSLSLCVTSFQRRPLEPTCTEEIIRSAARLDKTVHREVMNPHLSSSCCAWNQERQLSKHLSKHAHWCSRIFPSH